MNKQKISIGMADMMIPDYYQKVDSLPGDPEGSTPFMVQTENAACFFLVFPIDEERSMPLDAGVIDSGIRQYLSDNQGVIEIDSGEDYAYTIVKTLKEPSGVQYTLTYQKHFPDTIINVQGFFDEQGITGQRDVFVYNQWIKWNDAEGSVNNPDEGWTRDPYNPEYKKGALMNLSENADWDERFPGFPLSICRELVRSLKE